MLTDRQAMRQPGKKNIGRTGVKQQQTHKIKENGEKKRERDKMNKGKKTGGKKRKTVLQVFELACHTSISDSAEQKCSPIDVVCSKPAPSH